MLFIYCNIGLHEEDGAGYWSVDYTNATIIKIQSSCTNIYIGMWAIITNLSDHDW